MEPATKESKIAELRSDWVKDAEKLQGTLTRRKQLAGALTFISCALYGVLYWLVSYYREQVADRIQEFPIFVRIVLNIYQPFLIVFILITLSLLVLLFLRFKKPWLTQKGLMVLIAFNSVFAAILLAVSVGKVI